MKKWIRRGFIGLLCFATLIALFYAVEDYQGAKAWETVKTDLEARGENLNFEALIPPPVPNAQNFAATPSLVALFDYTQGPAPKSTPVFHQREIIDRLRSLQWMDGAVPSSGSWETQSFRDLEAWAKCYWESPNFPQAPLHVSAAKRVLTALDKYNSILEEFRAAAGRPQSRFFIHYDERPRVFLPFEHFTVCIKLGQVLAPHAIAALHSGDNAKALADLGVIWKCQQGLVQEPFLISQLVAISLNAHSIQPVWEGLAQSKWSESELKFIQDVYTNMDYLRGHQLALRGEAVGFGVDTLDYFKNLSFQERGWFLSILFSMSEENGSTGIPLSISLAPAGWLDYNKVAIVSFFYDDCLPQIDVARRRAFPARAQATSEKVQNERSAHFFNPHRIFWNLMVPAMTGVTVKHARAQAIADQVVIACALERCKIKKGKYPDALAALSPEFLKKVPHDIITGEPLQYSLEPNGRYKIYSVGWNEKDDGGTIAVRKDSPNRLDERQGDWVWAYPP
jgi:hypothetical protein